MTRNTIVKYPPLESSLALNPESNVAVPKNPMLHITIKIMHRNGIPCASVFTYSKLFDSIFASHLSAKNERASHLHRRPMQPIHAVSEEERPKVKIRAMFFTRLA